MNWNMLGALGEIVGALGVIVTLLYLARQVRAASLEGQRSRYNELSTSITGISRDWSLSDSLSDIMYRGLRDPSNLEPHEIFRFYSSVFGAMRAWEASYHYSRERGVHDWGAEGLRATMASLMAFPGIQHYWAERSSWFSPEFQTEVEEVIALGAPRMDEAYTRSGIAFDQDESSSQK